MPDYDEQAQHGGSGAVKKRWRFSNSMAQGRQASLLLSLAASALLLGCSASTNHAAPLPSGNPLTIGGATVTATPWRTTAAPGVITTHVTVTNLGRGPRVLNPYAFTLRDSAGHVYAPALRDAPDPALVTATIAPGEQLAGWLAFALPLSSTPTQLVFQSRPGANGFGDGGPEGRIPLSPETVTLPLRTP